MDGKEILGQERSGKDIEPVGSQDILEQKRHCRTVIKRAIEIAFAMLDNKELVVLDRSVQNMTLDQLEIYFEI